MTNFPQTQATIDGSEDIFLLMAPLARGLKDKHLWRVDLGRGGRVLGWEEIVCRNPDTHAIHPKAIFEGAFRRGAERIVLVHNHLDDDLELCDGDHILTGMMAIWGNEVGVSLFDHVIVTQGAWVSFRDQGLL